MAGIALMEWPRVEGNSLEVSWVGISWASLTGQLGMEGTRAVSLCGYYSSATFVGLVDLW